jgi:hypothetical protein
VRTKGTAAPPSLTVTILRSVYQGAGTGMVGVVWAINAVWASQNTPIDAAVIGSICTFCTLPPQPWTKLGM